MNTRLLVSSLVVLFISGVGGCSDHRAPLAPSMGESGAPGGVALARPDSNPNPPHPDPHPPIPIVQFAGADSAAPGGVSVTRWILGNDRGSAQTINWTLTDEAGWPSLPQSGSLVVPKRSTRPLEIAVAVPDSAAPGFYPIHMTATLRRTSATADGAIRVFGPPPDSLRIGARR